MKQTLNLWLSKNARIPGVLACGVRYPDKSVFAQSWSQQYQLPALENAWRTVGDTFQLLQLNRLPSNRLRWIYDKALLYASHRQDGITLGLFTTRDPQAFNLPALEEVLTQFESLKAIEP